VVGALWGNEPMSFGTAGLFFDKLSEGEVEIAWHQDSHLALVPQAGKSVDHRNYLGRLGRFHVLPTQMEWREDFHWSNIAVRINIDAQTRENGCASG
jgi:hypothetical protein